MPAIAQTKNPNRSIQLDGLRLFAMLAVFFHHFAIMRGGHVCASFGWAGLQLFMALSGFLTTRILLRDRMQTEAAGGNLWGTLGQFYTRRSLRIFPIYYLVIGIGFVLGLESARKLLGWLSTYTLNIYLTLTGNLNSVGPYAHLWSLSVQEQFYIFWALVVLFAPMRRLFRISCAMVIVAPIYRLIAVVFGWGPAAVSYFSLACLDSTGMGALLALGMDAPKIRERLDTWLTRVALPLGLVGTVILAIADLRWPNVTGVGINLALGLVSCWVIYKTTQGFRGPVGWVLELKPIMFLGRISYGLFIYHFFMPGIVGPFLRHYGVDFTDGGLKAFAIYSTAAIAGATLSWYVIEAPMGRIKDQFRPSTVPAPKPSPQPVPLPERDTTPASKPFVLANLPSA